MNIKGILIDVIHSTIEVLEIPKEIESYYRILNCDCIDIAKRNIGGISYEIIVDDSALLKDDWKVSAMHNKRRDCILAGNIFIVKFDGKDDITSLTEEDIIHIQKHIIVCSEHNPILITGEA